MRTLLVVCLALAVPACGKKKPAQAPANAAPASGEPSYLDDKRAPTDKDDKSSHSADPCEGGQ